MKWISVKDRLPEGTIIVIYYSPNVVRIGYVFRGRWFQFNNQGDSDPEVFSKVTHWMPLPEPPKPRHK